MSHRLAWRLAPLATLLMIGVLLALALQPMPADAARQPRQREVIKDQYIVTLKQDVQPHGKADTLARLKGLTYRHVYDGGINGFAATLDEAQVEALRADPDVVAIIPDVKIYAFADSYPNGLLRVDGEINSTTQLGSGLNPIDADVAIIDSGIDSDHPDLNVAGGVSCVPGEPSYDDANGHGTHVAGTVAALDNGTGVVGVAPGARVWAVRVLNAAGQGELSDALCGVNWVIANAGTIEVVNMSLGGIDSEGGCSDGGLHQAICTAIGLGVTFIVAAGNDGADAQAYVPASYDEVITVSAIVDTDGKPGGTGFTSFLYGDDDMLALFSNFGADVDIAAPGYGVYSTWLNGGYNYSSGTSMASPHVAGAAAIYAFLNPGASPADVKTALLGLAWDQASPSGFGGDVDAFPEPLLNIGSLGGPPLEASCSVDRSSVTPGEMLTVTCLRFSPRELIRVYLDDTATTRRASISTSAAGSGTTTFAMPDTPAGEHVLIFTGETSGVQLTAPLTVVPSMRVSSATTGKVGASVSVQARGFAANETLTMRWQRDATTWITLKTATSSATGTAWISFTVPEAVAGSYVFELGGGSSGATVNGTYTVVPGMTLSPASGRVGSNLTVKLSGYQPNEDVTVSWFDSPSSSVAIVSVTASALGSATVTVAVPEAAKDGHLLEAAGSAGTSTSATYTVTPGLATTATSGVAGSTTNLTLTGFRAGETIAVRWYDTSSSSSPHRVVASATASNMGSASLTLTIPEGVGGSHRLEAVGESSGGTSYTSYYLRADLALSPSSGVSGTNVGASITGFRAGEAVTIKWYSTSSQSQSIATATADGNGSATVSFDIPQSAVGSYKVEAHGGASSTRVSKTFTVLNDTQGGDPPTEAGCTADPTSATPGGRLNVSCVLFSPSETIRVYLDSTSTAQRASMTASTDGSAATFFTLPDAAAGAHTLIFVGASSGTQATAPVTVVPSIKITNATSGKVGAYVSIQARGFAANETLTVRWQRDSTTWLTLKTATSSATGVASFIFYVPEATAGSYTFEVRGDTSAAPVTATYTVVPGITLSPTAGRVGSNVKVTISGYQPNEHVTISWFDTPTSSTVVATVTASELGSASVTFVVPEAAKDGHRIDATGAVGTSTSATYSVTVNMSMSPTSATVGSTLAVTLSGYRPGETISIRWFDTSSSSSPSYIIASAVASDTGSASLSIVVPESVEGIHRIQATGESSAGSVYLYFTTKSNIVLSPASGPAGTNVSAELSGFRSGETVTIRWYATASQWQTVGTATANGAGSATVSFAVPASATGSFKVEARGGTSSARASTTFAVQ